MDSNNWLCKSLTVNESIDQTMQLNLPCWVYVMMMIMVMVMVMINRSMEDRVTQKLELLNDLGLQNDCHIFIRDLPHQKQIMLQ